MDRKGEAMATVTVEPISRIARPGSSISFKVRVEGDDASTVRVLPCKEANLVKF